MPGICVDFGGSLLGGLLGADSESEQQGNLKHCTASVQGETCNYCTICNEGQGYMFDCTNIEGGKKQSECVPAKIISGFYGGQEVKFLPKFDKDP